MKHQHHTITTTTIIYLCLFLLMGIISNVAFAETSAKISFAKVKDSSTSSKTAACIIAYPMPEGPEENIFCVYDHDQKFRDNTDIGKIFKSDGTLPGNNNDLKKNVGTWLTNNGFNKTAVEAISGYFLEYVKADPDNESIKNYLKDATASSKELNFADGCNHYNTLAPLITYEAFALFVHDFILHQKSADNPLIKIFCDNPATALVLLDEAIQPLLQNPDVVKLLNDKDAWSRLDSIKDKPNLLALLTPDKKDTKDFAKLLEILGNTKVTELLTKDEVVTLLRDPGVVKALVDEKFPDKINVAIQKHSEVQTLLSETKSLLEETKQQLGTAATAATAQGNSSLDSLNQSITQLPNTLTDKLKPLEEKIDKLLQSGTPELQTALVIVVCFLGVALLLLFFWLEEKSKWETVLTDEDSIIRKEFANLDNTQPIQTVLNRLATIEKKISAIPNTGASEDISGMDKAISDIKTVVKDAVAYAFTDYQNQQQSRPSVVEAISVQQVLEKVEVLKTTLSNYLTGQQLIETLNGLYHQGQEISNRLPLEPSFWTQLKGVVEQSIPQMSKQVSDINTALIGKPPVTLTDLNQSLSSTKEELTAALADSQKQQHTQMTLSLKPLSEKVANIDKLLKSKELWEENVLNPVKGVIETSLDFRSKYEAEQSQRQILETDRTTLLTVFEKRFGYIPPDRANLSPWATTLTEQPGTWRWSQSPLWQQLVICQGLFQQLQQREIAKDIQEILTLLFDRDQRFFTGWETLIAQLFKGDLEMWNYLRTLEGGKWLNSLFRANDLLHAYFADKPQFSELSKHLATTTGLLKVALAEMGIGFLEPSKLLENIPNDLPDYSKVYKPLPLLKKLVKSKVLERSKTAPRLVVDVEAYGFATPDNPQPEVRVVVFSSAEWQ